MNPPANQKPFVAIACGGTGGHLFPGLAVAEQLRERGCELALLVSPKDVDQSAVKSLRGMEVFTLPAVGLQNRNYFSFAKSFWHSFRAARILFGRRHPDAVLAMGGFTSAPPIFAAKKFGAKTFLHESNTIPGRANRLLARFVDAAYVGFPEAAVRLPVRKVTTTGTPVRPQFALPADQRPPAASCRLALGLAAERPTILVVGGSQGARGLNEMILATLPLLAAKNWQWLHLTGPNDFEKVKAAYASHGIKAAVRPFLGEMELALGAATVAVSRAGASSLAEMAAMRLPSVLVPLPTAADNHQYFNALAFDKTGAAHLLSQTQTAATAVGIPVMKMLAGLIARLVENQEARGKMQAALAQWHAPAAAEEIAENILEMVSRSAERKSFSVVPALPGRNSTRLKTVIK